MIKMAQIALKVGNINKRFSVPILISLLIKASNKSLHFNFIPHNFDLFFSYTFLFVFVFIWIDHIRIFFRLDPICSVLEFMGFFFNAC